jgi:hypothetical protein
VKDLLQVITHFNPNIIKWIVHGVPIFIIRKTMIKMFCLLIKYYKNIGQVEQGGKKKKREKEANIYQKIAPSKTLID